MRLISIHWLTLTAILIAGSQAFDEEDEDVTPSSATWGRWTLHRERRHWHAAALACRRASGDRNGRLAVPKSPKEARALARLLARSFRDPMDAPWVYLGLHDLAEQGEFISEDGVPIWTLGNLRWHAWDARGGPMDRCVVLDRFGLLWDVPCTWRLPFICALSPLSTQPTEPPCPTLQSQEEEGAKTFQLLKTPSNWWNAMATCARKGGHLAMPESIFHTHVLRDMLRDKVGLTEDVGTLRAFVGINDLARAGHMRNLNGEPFSLSDHQHVSLDEDDKYETTSGNNEVLVTSMLAGGEVVGLSVGEIEDTGAMDPIEVPSGATCLVVNGDGMYESASCTSNLPFFCEYPPPVPTACPTPPPPPPDPRMQRPPQGHFWLQYGRLNWNQAAKGCLDAGGVLAVPETPGEALAMADLLRSVPHPSDENIGLDIWAYIGIKDFEEDGEFRTIFGGNASVTAEEAARWGPGQPNGEGSQPCVVLDRDATLWDVPCGWELGYLCRRFPAEPPWATRGPFTPAGDRGVSWKVNSQEMRRWLLEMEALGAGAALKSAESGEELPMSENARGFANVDLQSWIKEFRNGLFDYAPFDFTPETPRT